MIEMGGHATQAGATTADTESSEDYVFERHQQIGQQRLELPTSDDLA
jgi:hypothetical protein